jgi:hypothetical protein
MHWLSIIYFFLVAVTTGTLIDFFVKDWQADWLEKLVMRFGVGLAAISVLGVIFNLLHIPLDYRVFLAAGILVFLGALARNRSAFSIEIKKIVPAMAQFWKSKSFWYGLFMLILFAVTVRMYVGGAFSYDYLEDTDPWGYTAVADFIGENKTFSVPYYSIQYSEPYTQGYQIVMGVLSQTNDSIYWTMKFFSALIVSFGVLFMYYFVRRFSRNEEVALLAGSFLFAVPAWVTHFVYSLHFNMTLFIVLLYVLAQLMCETGENVAVSKGHEGHAMRLDSSPNHLPGINGWMYVGIILYASMLVNHFSSAFHASVFCFVSLVTRTLAEKRVDWKTSMVFMGGFLLSLLFYVPAYAKHWWVTETTLQLGGLRKLFPVMHFAASPFGLVTIAIVIATIILIYRSRIYWQQPLEEWLAVGNRGLFLWLLGLALVLVALLQPVYLRHTLGTGDRYYVLSDFFGARAENLVNNPVGLGFTLMSAVVASLLLATIQIRDVFKAPSSWIAVSYAWVITAFLFVLGKYFSIAVSPFRVWTFLGLFASLFAAWGIVTFVQKFSKNLLTLVATMVLLAVVMIPTTFMPKLALNAMLIWPDDAVGRPESRALFAWMRDGGIPKNSVVAHLCGDSEFLSGYDMNPPVWDEVFHPKRGLEKPYFVDHPLNMTPEAYKVLKNAKVEYVTLGASCLWQAHIPADQEKPYRTLLAEKMDRLVADRRMSLIKDTGLEVLLKLN